MSDPTLDLYFWPTPNGFKVTIMLEECALPYRVHLIDIARGDQFSSDFLAISPNNKIPAITDAEGPDGKPLSVFESGAILNYLMRKTGQFLPGDERARVEIEQWLFWQMAGLGPMAGQCHHFRNYAPEKIPYAIDRYVNEVNRLYGVLEERLDDRDFVAGAYSIADMSIYPWTKLWKNQGQDIEEFPNIKAWMTRVAARPAVERGMAVSRDAWDNRSLADDKNAQSVLFGQARRKRDSSKGAATKTKD